MKRRKLPTNVQKWVDALRSGEYGQGKCKLKDGDDYCCLGVACDISGLGYWQDSKYVVDGEATFNVLPKSVKNWLGIEGIRGDIRSPTLTTDSGFPCKDLISVNDHMEYDFSQIADYIEVNWNKLKKRTLFGAFI